MRAAPEKEWWTAAELAEAGLPDMPRARQVIERRVKKLGWRGTNKARRRKGRGGGWEYHWSLLPMAAQQALLAQAAPAAEPPAPSREAAWEAFAALPERVKAKAEARLAALQEVEALGGAGMRKNLAVTEVARRHGVSARTLWGWFDLVEGVRRDDRLPWLAPRHRAAAKAGPAAECSPEFWEALKADFLRPEQPSFSSCYRRACRLARAEGWTVLPERTMRRRLEAELSPASITLARKGVDALKAMYPPQRRDRTSLHALEAVNADFHRFDVFVRWPDGPEGAGPVVRPQLVAFQDIYSGRILSWRVDQTPNKSAVALAVGDMVEEFGIPDHVILDNGREFANKYLTGQTRTRYRFRVRDDDIPGVLVSLGCEIHWAQPYSGQSKPIERAFRDFCDAIAKDPRFAGAWTGNRPDAKPENYGARAVPLETFLEVVAEGIEEHNARTGRRTETAQGRSFLETFEASYARAPIRKATAEQRRLWLMGAEGLRVDSRTGVLRFMKNEYWAPWLHDIAGERVVARFDPADLHSGLHVYALDGGYLGHAECRQAVGYFDVDEGRAHERARKQWMRAERAQLDAARRLRVADISAHLDGAPAPKRPAPPAEAEVVRPVFRSPAAAPPPAAPEAEAAHAALVRSFDEARAQAGRADESGAGEPDEPLARFRRALELGRRQEAGEAIGAEAARWLGHYRATPEYRAHAAIYEDFGEGMFG